jgi:hypothetical protein
MKNFLRVKKLEKKKMSANGRFDETGELLTCEMDAADQQHMPFTFHLSPLSHSYVWLDTQLSLIELTVTVTDSGQWATVGR